MRTIMTFPLSTCITLVQRYEDQLIWTIKYNQNLILEKFNPIVISLSSEKAIIITTSTTAELWWVRFHCFSGPTNIHNSLMHCSRVCNPSILTNSMVWTQFASQRKEECGKRFQCQGYRMKITYWGENIYCKLVLKKLNQSNFYDKKALEHKLAF